MIVTTRLLTTLAVAASIYTIGLGYRVVSSSSPVTHSWQTSEALQDTLQAVTDAETSQRGYLLTGIESYLAPYNESRSRLDAAMLRLMQLNRGRPQRTRLLITLRAVVDSKYAEMENIITARKRAGRAVATILVMSGIGKARMDRIRVMIGRLQDDEWRQLAVYDARRSAGVSHLVVGIMFLLVSVVSLFIVNPALRENLYVHR